MPKQIDYVSLTRWTRFRSDAAQMRSACTRCLLMLCIVLAGNASLADGGTKRALLIGINQYQKLPWLSGSINDVDVVRDLLLHRFGFAEENVSTLLDEAATRAGILEALNDLVASAGPDDTVLVHYSGHGSQVADLDGDEDDKLDETICPQDARVDGVPDITDDELGRILGRLNVASAVVILDSCHSGTALRSVPGDIRPRSVPPDLRVELYRHENLVSRGVVPAPGSEPYVLLSAAAPDQQELDGPFGPDGKRLGLLTAALSRALEGRSDDVSPRQLLDAIEQNVDKIKPMFAGHPTPEAQLEGRLDLIDKPLFSPVAEQPPRQLIVAPGADQPTQGKRRFFADPEKRRLLERAAATGIEWTEDVADADAVIDCDDDGSCDVYGPQGIVRVASMPLSTGPYAAERVASVAARAGSIAELLSIDESGGDVRLQLGATGRAETGTTALGTRGIKLTASVSNHHIRFYSSPEERTYLNSLQLSVQTDTPCYLTLASVDSAGNVQQLFPNPIQEQARFIPDGLLRPDQAYLIPDSFADNNRAGFHLDYAPPAGTDTIRAFCTVDRSLADALRRDIAAIADGQYGVSITKTLVSARGLTGLRPDDTPTPAGAWGASTITVDVAAR